MDDYESLSLTKGECNYHVVFIPKCPKEVLYGQLRRHMGEVFRELAVPRENRVEEGHLMPDHVHMQIAMPPTYAVSHVVGYTKGKSAIHLARAHGENRRNFVGQHFLGTWLFRVGLRPRRSSYQGIHPPEETRRIGKGRVEPG